LVELQGSKNGSNLGSEHYSLVIVSGKEEKLQIVTDFSRHTRNGLRATHPDPTKLLNSYFEQEKIRVHTFLSKYAGQGKSKYP
jgi:hypothetical protein